MDAAVGSHLVAQQAVDEAVARGLHLRAEGGGRDDEAEVRLPRRAVLHGLVVRVCAASRSVSQSVIVVGMLARCGDGGEEKRTGAGVWRDGGPVRRLRGTRVRGTRENLRLCESLKISRRDGLSASVTCELSSWLVVGSAGDICTFPISPPFFSLFRNVGPGFIIGDDQ